VAYNLMGLLISDRFYRCVVCCVVYFNFTTTLTIQVGNLFECFGDIFYIEVAFNKMHTVKYLKDSKCRMYA